MDSIDRQPHLVSPQLHLRPLRPDDWDPLYAVAGDPLIWELHPASDRWQKPVFRQFFEQALASGGALAAIDPAHGGIIGSSRYDLARAGPGEVEIGWTFLARRYWGGAMNAVMKRMMLTHAFRYVPRVIFVVGEHNLRSRRAMEKIGGVLTDRIVEVPGSTQGRHVVYAIDREAFWHGPLMDGR
ncbi:MAG: GNAT family N-acetyltransferase [Pseudomonadota bacterium]|jgi:RimJ/RimL family protein N-acetyltransferase|nr:MAG: N-acetyltransferase [Pseudomonadota bacterium]